MWFGIIERQALHRADIASGADLNKIWAIVTAWHDRCHPFVWTKTNTQILKKANRPTILKKGH